MRVNTKRMQEEDIALIKILELCTYRLRLDSARITARAYLLGLRGQGLDDNEEVYKTESNSYTGFIYRPYYYVPR